MILLPIACIGDSLTYGVGSDVSYPQYLSRTVGQDVVNLGVPGATTLNLVNAPSPEFPIVCVMIGHNDRDWWNADMRYTALADHLFSSNTVQKVYWGAPVLDRDGLYFQQCFYQDQVLKNVVAKERRLGRDVVYVPTFPQSYTYSDHVHLDSPGYKKLAGVFAQSLGYN